MEPQVKLRMPRSLFEKMIKDLRREHEFAFERAGFTFGRVKKMGKDQFIVFLNDYVPVDDNNYIDDKSVGARINSAAITSAMQIAFSSDKSSFHTHLHDFEYDDSMPQFSVVVEKNCRQLRKAQCHSHRIKFMDTSFLAETLLTLWYSCQGMIDRLNQSQYR